MEQYPMPFSRPLSALNGIVTKSGASQLQPTMKQPMSRISSMRRDWNDKPQPSQNPQSKVNRCQDTDPFPGGKSTAPEPKLKPRVPVKASTVSCTFSDKPPPSTAQWQIPSLSMLLTRLLAWEDLGLPSILGKSRPCDSSNANFYFYCSPDVFYEIPFGATCIGIHASLPSLTISRSFRSLSRHLLQHPANITCSDDRRAVRSASRSN